MRRRRFLRAAAAAGSGAALGGCATLDGSGPAGRTPPDDASVGSEPAALLDDAKAHLGRAVRALDEEAAGFAGRDLTVSFRRRRITVHLGAATDALDAAASAANRSQRRTIALLRRAARLLHAATRSLDLAADGFAALNAGMELYGAERYGRAGARFRAAKGHFAAAREAHGEATAHLEPLRTADAAVFAGADVGRLAAALGRFDAVLATVTPFADGYHRFARGTVGLFDGLDRYDEGKYVEAREAFASARERFAAARTLFAAAAERAPPELRPGVAGTECYAGAFREAAAKFRNAAAAAKNGNDGEAQDAMAAGRAALGRCSGRPGSN